MNRCSSTLAVERIVMRLGQRWDALMSLVSIGGVGMERVDLSEKIFFAALQVE